MTRCGSIACAAGDQRTAIRLAHDLKALSGTLGMPTLQPAASALQDACEASGDPAQIERALRDTVAELSSVLGELDGLAPRKPGA